MQKLFFLCLSVFLISTAHAKAQSADYAALISDTSNPYWKTFEDGLKDTAKSLNAQIDIYSLRNATDAEGQLNQCEAALLKNPKVLMFAAVNTVNLGPCLKKANEKNITLVDIDGNTDEEIAKKMGVNIAFSVASNNYDLGKMAADYIKGQTGKVLIIEGASGSNAGMLRIKGFKENLARGLDLVASQPADWDRLKAADITNRVLSQYPDLAFIFAANDTMALGAAEALHAAKNTNAKVIGVDGSKDAVVAIKEGRLNASIAQLPYLMAKEALEKSAAYLKSNQSLAFQQYIPIMVLDRSVFDKGNDPLLNYVR